MTQQELDKLRQLAEAATPGPWIWNSFDEVMVNPEHDRIIAATTAWGEPVLIAADDDMELVSAVISNIGELIRLARLGMEKETA